MFPAFFPLNQPNEYLLQDDPQSCHNKVSAACVLGAHGCCLKSCSSAVLPCGWQTLSSSFLTSWCSSCSAVCCCCFDVERIGLVIFSQVYRHVPHSILPQNRWWAYICRQTRIQHPTELWKKKRFNLQAPPVYDRKVTNLFFSHNYCFHNYFFSIILSVTVCPSIRNLNAF